MTRVIKLRKRSGGFVFIPVDRIKTIEYASEGSRNTGCFVNGIDLIDGFDFIMKALGWEIDLL